MNAIGADIVAMLNAGVARLGTEFEAMVIANQAVNFSVGANLMLLLMSAQEGEWDEIHMLPCANSSARPWPSSTRPVPW